MTQSSSSQSIKPEPSNHKPSAQQASNQQPSNPHKILFVCHGNICRSAMAEFILKDMVARRGYEDVINEIASCAVSDEEIGNPVYPPARRELAKHGISCDGKTARQITIADYEHFDLIIAMDRSNMRLLRYELGDRRMDKVRMLLERDVADPWYTGDFGTTYSDLVRGIEELLAKTCPLEPGTN